MSRKMNRARRAEWSQLNSAKNTKRNGSRNVKTMTALAPMKTFEVTQKFWRVVIVEAENEDDALERVSDELTTPSGCEHDGTYVEKELKDKKEIANALRFYKRLDDV